MFLLHNKTAVITGAGSGIGKAVALLFARQQAVVHALDLNEDALKETEAEIINSGGQVKIHVCDVTKQSILRATFESIGTIDILVNSAGISHIGKADSTPEEDFDRVFQVNV